MSSLPAITFPLFQVAVYWPPAKPTNHGTPQWGVAVEIACRWEETAEEFLSTQGERFASKAVVMVDQNVVVKGVLLLSALTSSVDTDNPKDNEGALEIRAFRTTPDFGATEELKEAIL